MKLVSWKVWFVEGNDGVQVDLTFEDRTGPGHTANEVQLTVGLKADVRLTVGQLRQQAFEEAEKLLREAVAETVLHLAAADLDSE